MNQKIRKHLKISISILFDNNGCPKEQLDTMSIAELIKSINFLEKVKDRLPDFYRKEIEYVIKVARYKL